MRGGRGGGGWGGRRPSGPYFGLKIRGRPLGSATIIKNLVCKRLNTVDFIKKIENTNVVPGSWLVLF